MPPTSRRRPAKPEPRQLDVVAPVDGMLKQDFRRHCQLRHARTMRFQTLNEHEQSHRLFSDQLDHIHTNQQEPEPEAGNEPEPAE